MESYLTKLMTLTSEFIEASADKTAREIRDELVADIFPEFTKKERDLFSDHTEKDDMLRMLEANFGDMIDDDEALVRVAEEAIRHLRHSEGIHRHEEGFGHEGQGSFAAGLNSIEKMLLLLNGDILGSAEYNVAHERRSSLVFEVFGGLEDDRMIQDMYEVTELDDAMREFKDVPMEGDYYYRCMAVALYLENLKAQCYWKGQSHSPSAGDYDENNWEPF